MSRQDLHPLSLLRSFWQLMLAASEAAVAIHYRQPWHSDAVSKADATDRADKRQPVLSRALQSSDRSQAQTQGMA